MFERFKKGNGAAAAAPAPGQPQSELHARRDELAGRVAELTWDLGGLTYEMAIRDHFRLDVLVRRAAELQEVDAQLGEVERLLASSYEGVGGSCRACGSPHSRGAVFCWHCGTQLVDQAPSAAAAVVPPAFVDDNTIIAAPAVTAPDDTIVGGGPIPPADQNS